MVDEAIQLATALVDVARDLLTGSETPRGAEKRIRDILPEVGESEKAARDLGRFAELDDPAYDADDPTNPGAE